jgi:BASS family bile acid:Na+ symporter
MKLLLSLIAALLVSFVAATSIGHHDIAGWLLVGMFLLASIACSRHRHLKGYAFTILIFAAASAAMYHPEYFIRIGNFKLSAVIVPLMQIIMFGMGTALSIGDFTRVVKMPKAVLAGVGCQFLIMPGIALIVTRLFEFPNEVAAGVILIGSCPGGLASNVMTYLARANLALSVTLTAISTIIAPFATPFLMSTLAGEYVEMNFWKMVLDIAKIVILPVAAGLIFNHFVQSKWKKLDDIMPLVSMGGIALIIVVITAAGRDELMAIGLWLILAMAIHNSAGYLLGYFSARLLGLPEADRRTIAIEVGLQNAGLGSSLALSMGKLATVGLASAVFAPLMNITGSALANWWRNRPPEQVTDQRRGQPQPAPRPIENIKLKNEKP